MNRLTARLVGLAIVAAMLAASGCREQEREKFHAEPAGSDAGAEPAPTGSTTAMGLQSHGFGRTDELGTVDLYELTNDHGMSVEVTSYGAMILAIRVPDRHGDVKNVTLGLETLEDYLAGHPYFGSTVGRYANRIAKGKFTIDDTEYTLATNNGPNHLHGGAKGFDKMLWKAEPIYRVDSVGVAFSYTSADREEGYPGRLAAKVTYTLNNENELKIDFEAETDAPTHVNLTNHAYWNLAGAGSGDVLGHELTINAREYLPVDNTLIPLGKPAPVADSPMDFTTPQTIGSRIAHVEGGYDHCYVLKKKEAGELSLAARVVEPKSGRVMEMLTTQPGIQFYSGNSLDGTLEAEGHAYQKHAGFCLEAEHFPDSPHHPEYPSTLLKPGEKYHETTIYRFGVQEGEAGAPAGH